MNTNQRKSKDLPILLRFSSFSLICVVGHWHYARCQFADLRRFYLKVSTMLAVKPIPKDETMHFFLSSYHPS